MDFNFILFISLLVIAYLFGSYIETKHFNDIKRREIKFIKKPIISFGAKKWKTNRPIKKVELVTGEVVIGADHFKSFVADIKSFFGGRLTTYESILDRGRREAILRMRESAKLADIIVNVRVESVQLNTFSGKKNSKITPKISFLAYGTAITYDKKKQL